MFYHYKYKTAVIALVLGLTLAQPTVAATIHFDSLGTGANANLDSAAIALGITFNNAAWLPDLDSDSLDIPGSEHWQVDSSLPGPVTVENTFLKGWGTAPSGQNALDARWSAILLQFAAAVDMGSFSVVLPDSAFGNLFESDILFLDAAGNTLLLAGTNHQCYPGFRCLPVKFCPLQKQPAGIIFDHCQYHLHAFKACRSCLQVFEKITDGSRRGN